MRGHWECNGESYTDKQTMWEEVVRDEIEGDFYDWIDDNYRASTIFDMLSDVMNGDAKAEMKWFEVYDDFCDEMYGNDEPVKGEDFDFCGVIFDWVDDMEVWDDFIGNMWSVEEFKEMVAEHNAEKDTDVSAEDYVRMIVDSVYNDTDFWWTEEDDRQILRAQYPDKDSALNDILEILSEE